MFHIGVIEFRTNMSAILQRVRDGETVVLTRGGEDIAIIVPAAHARTALDALSQTAIVGDALSPDDEEWQVAE